MKKNNELKFSVLKVKRMIQENKEIGKIANMTPYLVSKSLETFMTDLLNAAVEMAKTEDTNKVHAKHIKRVIENNPDLEFLLEVLDEEYEEKSKKQKLKKPENN